ncbi:uncharacterized protein LOC141855794 [Brevipalpus obovatus]|uniref:uncharacterized protein LOC141855794 n=1 Tax=Brevipalpus obovatus TaxID=246614 RepID=UPI003D9EEA3A
MKNFSGMRPLIKTVDLSVYVGGRSNSVRILNNVNFTIHARSITGLIAPSGSGKTTLIRAIIGLLPNVFGDIVMNERITRSDIGYMPQELALSELFSASDMLFFTGNVYGMSREEIENRIKEFQIRLNLPTDLNQRLTKMSGGQKRRVSLAMALFHCPKVVLLDEPTVGSDPVTCWKIWDYLRECRDVYGQTVVITTHYLEEVRKADYVSVMRKGQLIYENTVLGMLSDMQVKSIEHAVTKIYQLRAKPKILCDKSKFKLKKIPVQFQSQSKFVSKIPDDRPHIQIIRASLIRMISKTYLPVFLAFCFGLSCMIAGTVFALSHFLWRPPKSSICIVDTDQSATSRALHQNLKSSWFFPEACSSLEQAHQLVESQMKVGYLHIAGDFESSIQMYANNRGFQELSPPRLRFYGDNTKPFAIEFTLRWLDSQVLDIIRNYRALQNLSQPLHDIIKIESFEGKTFQIKEDGALDALIPIMLLFFGFQYANSQSSVRIGIEKKYSFHERQQSMGITWSHQVVAYLIRDFLFTSVIYTFTVFILLRILGKEFNDTLLIYLAIVYLVVATSMCTGLFLASIISSLTEAIAILFAINLTVFWFNGLIWSRQSLPYFMTPLNYLVPYDSVTNIALSFFNDNIIKFDPIKCFAPMFAWAFVYVLAAVRPIM